MKQDWIECTLQEAFETVTGNTPPKKEKENYGDEIPFIKPPQIENNTIITSLEYLSLKGKEKARILPINSVLVTCIGNLGRVGLNKKEVAFNQQINAIKPVSGIEAKFTFYQAQSIYFRNQLEKLSTSTTVSLVNKTSFNSIRFKIAPLTIQKAIVKKIEALFSDLDQGIADLKKAQEQLKIYRQAVLKKAFEGELTKEWREKQTNLPSADELLEQIKVERQKYYEEQIEDWKKALKNWEKIVDEGKKPAKPQKIKQFNGISEDDYCKLPKLPSSWDWEKFGNVCLKIMDGTHFSPKNIENGDFKYITAKNIKEGRIDLKNLSYVTKEDHLAIYARCDVKKGDILYIKDGATTGRAAINNFDEEFSLLSSVGVFRTSHNLILPKFLEHYLNAQITRNRMLSNIAGVAITRLTLVKLNNSVFIICSPEEQHQIVKEIESRLSVCDAVEQNISESLEKAKALRQSILKKAFEGKLLSEEEIAQCKAQPDYEPASVLLEKIKKEKKK
ncbi:restriction endonuclease subunit S [Psychroflexus aestuariivivens]|uniref:restriction endonuclease subunit S n=1 Tax=Psychroflexus aestuariivivens TaxID=1795040 RepID=UPI000FD72029|nr:restriction endonuclease subunit S [Psychroflexus aestuariivivens]